MCEKQEDRSLNLAIPTDDPTRTAPFRLAPQVRRLLMAAIVSASFAWQSPTTCAQESTESTETHKSVVTAAQDLTRGVLPFDSRTDIGEERYWLAYLVAIIGFLIVVALTVFAVRLLAFLAIVVAVVGGALSLCISLYHRGITTWEDLAVAIVTLGVAAGIITVSAGLYVQGGNKPS